MAYNATVRNVIESMAESTMPSVRIGFQELRQKSKRQAIRPPSKLLGLDPGGTTGFSLFVDGDLKHADQFKSTFTDLNAVLNETKPDAIVCESFRLYPWKLDEQSWSSLQTPRFIGAIEHELWQRKIPFLFQTASQGKNFCTNIKLKQWGFYLMNKRHANDATRHVCAYLLFGGERKPVLMDGNLAFDGENPN